MCLHAGMVRALVGVACVLGLMGCSSEEGPSTECTAPDNPAAFEVGTGEACFERLSEGQTVPLMSGPQGGYHVWLAVGCADCAGDVILRYKTLDPATMEPLAGTEADNEVFAQLDASSGWAQQAGIQIGMPGSDWDPELDPHPAPGTELILQVQALSASTEELLHEASVELTIGETMAWDPCDLEPDGPCCDEACN